MLPRTEAYLRCSAWKAAWASAGDFCDETCTTYPLPAAAGAGVGSADAACCVVTGILRGRTGGIAGGRLACGAGSATVVAFASSLVVGETGGNAALGAAGTVFTGVVVTGVMADGCADGTEGSASGAGWLA